MTGPEIKEAVDKIHATQRDLINQKVSIDMRIHELDKELFALIKQCPHEMVGGWICSECRFCYVTDL